jgi:mannose-6-phosphate isomerase-like protein (cupin superfamily)
MLSGVKHNIVNTSNAPLKLYTVYAPPEHRDRTIHNTKADAFANEEEFDGETTE